MTLNINGIASPTRLLMLRDFIYKHDADFVLLQEVTNVNILNIRGYHTFENIGTSGRGTAILSKVDLHLHRIKRLPTGRGIAAYFDNTCIINLYAPSGTANRADREYFYNTEILDLIPHTPTDMIMAGDFNCVTSSIDSTGHCNRSRALERLIHGLDLEDAWDATPNRQIYTHYTSTGAARLDRIYVTEEVRRQKQGVETIVAAFTDHLAVLLRVAMSTPITHRGKGRWTMNISYLKEVPFQDKIKESWEKWKTHISRFPDIVQWWDSTPNAC